MNILTIDFDIIMQPSIEFYNDLIGTEEPLKNYIDDFSFIAHLPANLYIYEYLTRYIITIAKSHPDNIFFISDHSNIIKILKSLKINEEINLINIDHHHDLGYGNVNWKKPTLTYNCGNWAKYCLDKKIINHYGWIHNDNSDMYPEEAEKYITKEIELQFAHLDKDIEQSEYLIICASYEWIPPLYHSLFLTWQTMCEEMNDKEYPLDKI